jgi:DNA-binding response OmpR family regulator
MPDKNQRSHGKHAFEPLRILVIEDNQDVAGNISDYLEEKGHVVDFAMDGITGLHLAVTQPVDVIVLDIMLPGMDGLDLCRRFREEAENSTPILMLTAKDTLDDKLQGFKAGADDYLLKPFALEELEARLQALVRRSIQDAAKIIEVGKIRLDRKQRSVTKGGKEIKLNRTCFRILFELMRSAPGVVAREDLEHILWGDFRPASDVLRSHIYTLRKALDSAGEESLIETVIGIGFRMRSPS